MNICIFGDSITWGARLPFRVGWANLLRNHLEKVSDDFFSVYDLGIDKNTSTDLLERFEVEARARNPEVIIFAIGTNDSSFISTKNKPMTELVLFEENLRNLSSLAKKYTSRIIFVGLTKGDDNITNPLPQSTTGKSYDKDNIDKYSQIIKKVCETDNLTYIDLKNSLVARDFADGLHPNESGHKKIFKAVSEKIDLILDVDSKREYSVVNERDEVVGEKQKEAIDKNDIFRVSGLWISNGLGEILIAQRQFHKKNDSGKWGPAAACFVENNETYEQAILKAAKNELDLKNLHLNLSKKMFLDGENRFFCQWFESNMVDGENIVINNHEVFKTQWIALDKLIIWVKKEPHLFVQDFEKYLKIFS